MQEIDKLVEALDRLTAAQNRIADAQYKQVEATVLLARATAGEFDGQEEAPEPPKPGKGMGMIG